MNPLLSALGHAWTIAPNLFERLLPVAAPSGVPWSTVLEDPVAGPVTLRGWLHDPAPPGAASGSPGSGADGSGSTGSDTLVVLVHGLGGSPDGRYVKQSAFDALSRGAACLRLGLRGSDRQGDLYHAGLVEDLHGALRAPSLERYRRIHVLGFSMGGMMTLRAACEPELDPRVVSVAAIGSPLDMPTGHAHMDAPGRLLYRRHVLSGLREIHSAAAARGRLFGASADVSGIRSVAEWDARVIVPRFGFRDMADYHSHSGLTGRTDRMRVPALLLASRYDPMIPLSAVTAGLGSHHPNLSVRVIDSGGHVSVPRAEREGVMEWLLSGG